MEPTYGAEGDYDFGHVDETKDGETPFKLIPDDHTDVIINGTIVAKPDSEIVTVTLRGYRSTAAQRTGPPTFAVSRTVGPVSVVRLNVGRSPMSRIADNF